MAFCSPLTILAKTSSVAEIVHSAPFPPSLTVTLPSWTSTFHVPAPSISNTYELFIPAVLAGSTRVSSPSKNSFTLSPTSASSGRIDADERISVGGKHEIGAAATMAVGSRRVVARLLCLLVPLLSVLATGCGGARQEMSTPAASCVISVFFVLALADDPAEAARDRLTADERVASIRLTTSAEALAGLRSKSPALVDALKKNHLPSKLELVPKRASDARALAQELRSRRDEIESVRTDGPDCPSPSRSIDVRLPPLPRAPEELAAVEKQRFDARIQRELAAGRRLRARHIAANRAALDRLPRYPGSKLLYEDQNAELKPFDTSVGELEFSWYANRKVSLEERRLIESESWGTFRTYSVPPGTSPRAVWSYFSKRLQRQWRLERDGANGRNGIYSPIYLKASRCVWFHIGVAAGPLPKGRFFTVATHSIRGSECF